jgi:hypothetical protein
LDETDMRRPSRTVSIGDTPYGRGVFARCFFVEGEVIGEIQGRIIDDPDYGSDYCMNLGDTFALEPAAPFRYVNHSCRPNCRLALSSRRDPRSGRERRVLLLKAILPIAPGDQVTIDYEWPADHAIRCQCGSPNCRGWIVAREELAKLRACPDDPTSNLNDQQEHTV